MVHNWARAGNIPGTRQGETGTVIAGRVVEAGRPHPSGHFGQKFRDAAEEAEAVAGAGHWDAEEWRA
jgi:hypothetical protein